MKRIEFFMDDDNGKEVVISEKTLKKELTKYVFDISKLNSCLIGLEDLRIKELYKKLIKDKIISLNGKLYRVRVKMENKDSYDINYKKLWNDLKLILSSYNDCLTDKIVEFMNSLEKEE